MILRWADGVPAHLPLLKQAGIQTLVVPGEPQENNAAFREACSKAGIETIPQSELKTFTLAQLPAEASGYAALSTGLWPGIGRGAAAGRDDEASMASREPWVDSNGYWIAYLRALYPNVPALLAYQAGPAAGLSADRAVPFDTLTLALVEARVMGGNYILSMDPQFRTALLAGDAKAVAAWKQLGITAQWLKTNAAWFQKPPMPAIQALVEPGRPTAEIANLLFRRSGSPMLTRSVPASLPPGLLAFVTTAVRAPFKPELAKSLLQLASQGCTVVTDDVSENAWWKPAASHAVKTQDDRIFYAHGKGAICAYRKRIADPSEHALDVIDIVTHAKRPIRIWNAPSVIAVATSGGAAHLINYGTSSTKGEVQARIQGMYRKAVLHRPGLPSKELEAAVRGTTTEVFIPEITRIATVQFS
ncbi:hypothetical protein F183_A11720 [Bryobacterales bacterium F-183]|nr:hypothetical protein F183_A11720 [Bryobacterales bacterium F-183]